MANHRSGKNDRKRSKPRNRVFKRIFFVSIVIFVLLGVGIAYVFNMLDKMEKVDISKNDEELGITKETSSKSNKKITNIALFGIDRREDNEVGRSDSIMIATIDREHKKIKLTSLLRDTYVDIPNHGMDKLGHAHAYGGPELAIKTINHNFNMDIREFAAVDFESFPQIIDILGGIEVDIKPEEVKHVPGNREGIQLLDGEQALAYSRIRKVGSDYQRTERQRIVLEKILNKGMRAGVTKYPSLLNAILPYVETSLSKSETLSLGSSVLTSKISTIDQYRIPVKGYVNSQRIDGISYEVPNTMEDNVGFLNDFIYKDKKESDN